MIPVVRPVEGTDGEDLLEVRRRVASVHSGQGLLAVGDVAAILIVVRAPDRHLRFERQIEERACRVVERVLNPFVHAMVADHEEADLAADFVELEGGGGDLLRVRACEALEIEDGDGGRGHDGAPVDGRVRGPAVPPSCHGAPTLSLAAPGPPPFSREAARKTETPPGAVVRR